MLCFSMKSNWQGISIPSCKRQYHLLPVTLFVMRPSYSNKKAMLKIVQGRGPTPFSPLCTDTACLLLSLPHSWWPLRVSKLPRRRNNDACHSHHQLEGSHFCEQRPYIMFSKALSPTPMICQNVRHSQPSCSCLTATKDETLAAPHMTKN